MGKGQFRDAKWCPFCGVESLERDKSGETKRKPSFKNEFHCTSCGKGIMIGPSTRYLQATALARGHRQMRPPELPPKVKPEDSELHALRCYAAKIGVPNTIIRSQKKLAKFNFLDPATTHCVGSMDFRGALQFLRGYEVATRNNGDRISPGNVRA